MKISQSFYRCYLYLCKGKTLKKMYFDRKVSFQFHIRHVKINWELSLALGWVLQIISVISPKTSEGIASMSRDLFRQIYFTIGITWLSIVFNSYLNIICPWKKWSKYAENVVSLFPVHGIFKIGCPEGNSVCLSVCEMVWKKKQRTGISNIKIVVILISLEKWWL